MQRAQGGEFVDGNAHRITAVGHQIGQPVRLERAESIAFADQTRSIDSVEANGGRDVDRMLRSEDARASAG